MLLDLLSKLPRSNLSYPVVVTSVTIGQFLNIQGQNFRFKNQPKCLMPLGLF